MDRPALPENLLLGTSSFSSADWYGVFYPRDLAQNDMLAFYARRYPTVEIDSTFYGIPSEKTVQSWREKTPEGFQIAVKMPQVITHEKFLVDCDDELALFLDRMALLGDRLGPILVQFRYFRRAELSAAEFLERLSPFIEKLPAGRRFAVEVRNKPFVTEAYLDLLRRHRVAFTLIDHPWFERPGRLASRLDPVTADFSYVRWLGDRHKIEDVTKTWDHVVVDREHEMDEWAEVIADLLARNVRVYAFANNHFSGHAPAALELFRRAFLARAPAAGVSATPRP
jgi:uncharacterized protein YecE (DUF72 family)